MICFFFSIFLSYFSDVLWILMMMMIMMMMDMGLLMMGEGTDLPIWTGEICRKGFFFSEMYLMHGFFYSDFDDFDFTEWLDEDVQHYQCW